MVQQVSSKNIRFIITSIIVVILLFISYLVGIITFTFLTPLLLLITPLLMIWVELSDLNSKMKKIWKI